MAERWRKCENKDGKICLIDGLKPTKSDCMVCTRYKPEEEPTRRRIDMLPSMGVSKVADIIIEMQYKPRHAIEAWLSEEVNLK